MTIDDVRRKAQASSLPGLWIVPVALLAMLVQGYHPGAEDDAVYLAAIHARVHPGLYPMDSSFFRVQLQASIYDRVMAASVRLLHLPVNVVMLAWQFAAICLLLYACLRLARHLFAGAAARWAAVTLVALLFALPVAGTALFLVDSQLHPRTLATALILLAADALIANRTIWCIPLLLLAALLHPIMAAFGVSFCVCMAICGGGALHGWVLAASPPAMLLTPNEPPLGWLLDRPTDAWRQAMATRRYIFLSRWTWYEWLGVLAPFLLLEWCRRWAAHNRHAHLARVCAALLLYSAAQLTFALVVTLIPALVRVLPLQPMRYLHLVFLLGALIGGGLLGEFVLRARPLMWAIAFVPLALGMVLAERSLYPDTSHLELPGISDGAHSTNPWLQAFAWVAANTPHDAYFALDPNYMELPGEDYHGFRALAQRSVLADAIKDSAVAMQVPRLAPVWQRQVTATQGFDNFHREDFARLHREFGVTWTVLLANRNLGFDCPYHNAMVQVCKLPTEYFAPERTNSLTR
jgi:hypothetical protein